MKNSFRVLTFLSVILPLMSATCWSPTARCSDDIACTMIFTMVAVEVKNSAGQPVKLDTFYTIRKRGHEIIYSNQALDKGHYTVLDDGYQKKLALQTDSFFFVGKLNGIEVIYEPFTISADCCHIQKQSGKTLIVL